MAGDHQIVRTDHAPLALQPGPDVAEMSGHVLVKGQHLDTGGQPLDLVAFFGRPVRFCSAMQQFGERDRQDARAARLGVEPRARALRRVAQDADGGVEHAAQPHHASRSGTAG